jgi:hypothetical protein
MNEFHRPVTLARTDKRIFRSISLVQAYPAISTFRHSLFFGLSKSFLKIPAVASSIEY